MCVDTLADVSQRSPAREELGNDPNDGCAEKTQAPSTGISFGLKTEIFSGLAYLSHVSIENGHRKRIFKNAGHFRKLRFAVLVWMDENGSM